jgi:hypothetical protein
MSGFLHMKCETVAHLASIDTQFPGLAMPDEGVTELASAMQMRDHQGRHGEVPDAHGWVAALVGTQWSCIPCSHRSSQLVDFAIDIEAPHHVGPTKLHVNPIFEIGPLEPRFSEWLVFEVRSLAGLWLQR